ncbi:NUDIX hydrolase [Pararhizobium antarcticum]|uniref:DNA mismatch repair protein MutT n=1 Tax=Pararhizobium antarcticum TaxID=1798805 RepID=A0A657LN50_9HYPH|nr:NUDIX hydrolase [Pararhizobium antarcticum]OJF91427.1 DNA mismatch repair protein MutT [Pararhizobium antarcticum]OJF94901.1 DNA mismatch repair protein MutT [Rhizobium sp. 58]
MAKRRMIRVDAGERRFNFRIAGLGFRNGHVLVHRATHEPFWTFPGGRAEIGETSAETLRREMIEELGVEVTVGRMLWTVENFFRYEQRDYHEIGFYYRMDIPQAFPFHETDIVHRLRDGKNDLEFKWARATVASLRALDIPPYFIAEQIESLPETAQHILWHDGNLDRPGS